MAGKMDELHNDLHRLKDQEPMTDLMRWSILARVLLFIIHRLFEMRK